MMEYWNVGIVVKRKPSEDKVSSVSSNLLLHHSNIPTLKKSDVGLVHFLAKGNSYLENGTFIDLTFYGNLSMMV